MRGVLFPKLLPHDGELQHCLALCLSTHVKFSVSLLKDKGGRRDNNRRRDSMLVPILILVKSWHYSDNHTLHAEL